MRFAAAVAILAAVAGLAFAFAPALTGAQNRTPRFAISAAQSGVFRVDQISGEVIYCGVAGDQLHCANVVLPAVK
jgi:hypothetical protein